MARMVFDFLFWWRVSNAIIALAALTYLMLDLRVVRQTLGNRRLFLTFSLAGLLLATVLGSINNILRENAISPATPLITASCLWCLIGLYISKDERPSVWKDFPK